MKQAFWTDERVAGSLLIVPFLLGLLALLVLIASGALPAFLASLEGSLAAKVPYEDAFRQSTLLWVVGWIVQLLGFSQLARLLARAGEEQLSIMALIAIFIAAIVGVLHGTFHISVEAWAARAAAQTGSLPELYEPLQSWIGISFRVAYITHLAATALFGWAILRAGTPARWSGWMSISWSVLWIASYLVGAGAPGILFIMPTIIGVALLLQ